FDFGAYVGDYVYWFIGKNEPKQRASFFGFGGMTTLYLPPDPDAAPRKVPIPKGVREHPAVQKMLAQIDPDSVYSSAAALKDKFLKQSLELYGAELPKSPEMKGVAFVVPLLSSAHLLSSADERNKLGELCDFYISESPDDAGIILASKKNHQN